jgi:hypothetical protein
MKKIDKTYKDFQTISDTVMYIHCKEYERCIEEINYCYVCKKNLICENDEAKLYRDLLLLEEEFLKKNNENYEEENSI